MATSPKPKPEPNPKVWLYLLLLTLQYGSQPLLSKRFVRCSTLLYSTLLVLLSFSPSLLTATPQLLNSAFLLFFYRREVIVTSLVLACEVAKVPYLILILISSN
jgi:hypothetical protein